MRCTVFHTVVCNLHLMVTVDCSHVLLLLLLLLLKGNPGYGSCGSGLLVLLLPVRPRPFTLLQLSLCSVPAGLGLYLVLTGRMGASSSRVRITIRPIPEPGVVCVLQQSPGQSVLQHLLVTFTVGLPFGVSEFLHVLRADPLGHHLVLSELVS